MKLIVKFNTGDWLAVGVIVATVVGIILVRKAQERKAENPSEDV